MLRHRLAPLFKPASLLLVSPPDAPVAKATVPERLLAFTTRVRVDENQAPQFPPALQGLAPNERLDLAVVCVAPGQLPVYLEAIAVYRPRILLVLSSSHGADNSYEALAYSRSWGYLNDCQVLGPRSLGVQLPVNGINLSHVPQLAKAGRVALVAQSGSLVSALLDWAADVNMGFSAVVSLGHEAGIDAAEVLDYLATDPHTDSVALYLKETPEMRRLASALRAVSAAKPVVVLRPRHRSDGVADRIEDTVFNTLLRRVGTVRVPYFIQLFSALRVLRYPKRPAGRRVGLLSNSSGAAQLALDVMGPTFATERARLPAAVQRQLEALLAPACVTDNPVVSSVPFTPERLREAVRVLMEERSVDGLLVLLTPDPLTDTRGLAAALIEVEAQSSKPLVTCLLGESSMRGLRQQFDQAGLPVFRTPESAASALGVLASYHYGQSLARQILPPQPLDKPPLLDSARNVLNRARRDGRFRLQPDECRRLFQCFSIPVDIVLVPDGVRAVPSGLQLSLDNTPMAIRVRRSPTMGPYISFGAGGVQGVAGLGESLELPPLNSFLARHLVERSAVWKQVLVSELSPTAVEALQDVLQRLSELVSRMSSIGSIDIDPLFADASGLVATGVEVGLVDQPAVLPESSGYRHMAIHPYPRELVQVRQFRDGRQWLMRPIRPEDAEPLQVFTRGLSRETRYLRFVSVLRELTPNMLSRYTRIDYERELALVAAITVPNPHHRGLHHEQIIGFAHYLRNADSLGAEIALVIADDWQRLGLGRQLLMGLIEAAKMQGFSYLDGYVLPSNTGMVALMIGLGFRVREHSEDPEMRYLVLDLA